MYFCPMTEKYVYSQEAYIVEWDNPTVQKMSEDGTEGQILLANQDWVPLLQMEHHLLHLVNHQISRTIQLTNKE